MQELKNPMAEEPTKDLFFEDEIKDDETVESTVNNNENSKDIYARQKDKQKEDKEKEEKVKRVIRTVAFITLIIIIILLLLRSCGNGDNIPPVATPTPTGTGTVSSDETSVPNPTVNPEVTLPPTVTPTPLAIDEGGDWDGDSQTNFGEQEEIEYTTIPGFTDIVVNEKNQEIQLYNLPENTVYFVYTITNADTGEKVYETKAIAPGKATKWNVYDTFGKGVFTIGIEISTYDVTTQEQCYGAKQTVTVVVQ